MDKWQRALRQAKEALEQIARRENSTVEVVRKHIQIAIISGMTNPDPAIQKAWNKIPREGAYPTPEEVIAYLSLWIQQPEE